MGQPDAPRRHNTHADNDDDSRKTGPACRRQRRGRTHPSSEQALACGAALPFNFSRTPNARRMRLTTSPSPSRPRRRNRPLGCTCRRKPAGQRTICQRRPNPQGTLESPSCNLCKAKPLCTSERNPLSAQGRAWKRPWRRKARRTPRVAHNRHQRLAPSRRDIQTCSGRKRRHISIDARRRLRRWTQHRQATSRPDRVRRPLPALRRHRASTLLRRAGRRHLRCPKPLGTSTTMVRRHRATTARQCQKQPPRSTRRAFCKASSAQTKCTSELGTTACESRMLHARVERQARTQTCAEARRQHDGKMPERTRPTPHTGTTRRSAALWLCTNGNCPANRKQILNAWNHARPGGDATSLRRGLAASRSRNGGWQRPAWPSPPTSRHRCARRCPPRPPPAAPN